MIKILWKISNFFYDSTNTRSAQERIQELVANILRHPTLAPNLILALIPYVVPHQKYFPT